VYSREESSNRILRQSESAAWTGFGPGKVILLGEHAVVYGHPALAAALRLGVTARGTPNPTAEWVLPEALSPDARQVLGKAFSRAREVSGAPTMRLELTSDLPVAVGLGSSAAVSVACARMLLGATGKEAVPSEVLHLAQVMEQEFHGTPSGVDHSCSTEGGMIRFERPVGEVGSARLLSPRRPISVVVVISGPRTPTRTTVGSLRERQGRWSERYARLFREIGRVAEDGVRAVEEGDLEALGDAMNVNHGLLCALGLSSQTLDDRVHALRKEGALGAKLTGAGGDGGAVIALFRDPGPIVEKLRAEGLDCFSSELGSLR
jgi:mevalonate kinase